MDAFQQEEARNPTMWVIGKKGMFHLHDSIGVRGTGFNRAPCGARPPAFGMKTLAQESVLPTSWSIEYRGDKSIQDIRQEHRQLLRDNIENNLSCAICREAARQFIETMWARWDQDMSEGASASGLRGSDRVQAAANRSFRTLFQALVEQYGGVDAVPAEEANERGAKEIVAAIAEEFGISEFEAARLFLDANKGTEVLPVLLLIS